MNVQVKHEGTAISGYVISYEREHKICTGIGNLTVTVDRTIPRTFNTWDTIDIWENGSFKVRYYVSSVTDSEPKGEIVLNCQDISKRLVDYFIPDSYTVDYPSYTRYWIEKFLTEAGLDYQFTTTSQGTLLSNFTQLGLVTAYEQLTTLLQMSGWYMYFSGDEKAVIGSLDLDLATSAGSVGKTDVLSILKTSNDKMLRNRAVVLGAYDPYTGTYASADVSVHTAWNYDHRDQRTVVISNSNIPNKGTAYGMANQIIKEFARITVEKHIELWGARNYSLGRALRVNTNVWRGRGLITTFGVSMGKDGLITKIILDERCPRLFGYFDYGDYVYVSTYGDGIWRKHLKFDPTWYNFSTGLTDLRITDMHINNDVFGAVGASGQMYGCYGNDSTWQNIPTPVSLDSSLNNTASGDITLAPFSGIMARAVIVDKVGNVLKFAVDNSSGLNQGDYFMMSGWLSTTGSGVMESGSGYRSWILEYDPVSLQFVGSGTYPVFSSGNYNIQVIDLENDGKNDYVSVKVGGTAIISGDPSSGQFNYGYGNANEYPKTSKTSWSSLSGAPDQITVATENAMHSWGAVDNVDDREFFWTNSTQFKIVKIRADNTALTFLAATTVSLPSGLTPYGQSTAPYAAIIRPSPGVYKFLAQGDTITYAFTTVVTITHNGGESYSVTASPVSTDDRISPSHQEGHLVAVQKTDITTENWKIFAGVVDLLTANMSFSQVYSSGGTTANPKHPGANFFVLNGILCGVGYELEWDSATPSNKLLSALYMNGGSSLIKGNVLTGGISSILDGGTLQLSKIYAATTVFAGGTTYIVYNNGMTDVLAEPIQAEHFIQSSAYYNTAIRINGTTLKLQTSPIPLTSWTTHDLGDDKPVTGPVTYLDSVTGDVHLRTKQTSNGKNYMISMSSIGGGITSRFEIFTTNSPAAPGNYSAYSVGNFIIIRDRGINNSMTSYYVKNLTPALGGTGPSYQVLRRDSDGYTVIEQESYPIRVDISNNTPVLTVGSGEQLFKSNFVYDTELVVVDPTLSGVNPVNDYRYTFLEPTLSGMTISGMSVGVTGLYVYGSGIWGADILTYSGGFSLLYPVPSGNGTRLETSNFGVGGQYIFVTTSGFVQTFYQKDPGSFGFVEYSGLPQSRATMIRLDDII